jgi:hypothetical protein
VTDVVHDIVIDKYGLRTFKPANIFCGPVLTSTNKMAAPPRHRDGRILLNNPEPVTTADVSWYDGTCEAVCLANVDEVHVWQGGDIAHQASNTALHVAPEEGCSSRCGIYALDDLANLARQFNQYAMYVVVVIRAEGKTIVGGGGFRTQKARVVAYWCRPDPSPDPSTQEHRTGWKVARGRDCEFPYEACCTRQFADAQRFDNACHMAKEFGLVSSLCRNSCRATQAGAGERWNG